MAETTEKKTRKRSPKVKDEALAKEVAEQKARLERVQRLATVKEKVAKLATGMGHEDVKDLLVYVASKNGIVLEFQDEE